jgi:hypothetical protein
VPRKRPGRLFLEAADLPVGRDASASRSTRSRGSYDLVCSCRFRPSRSSAASKTSRSQSARGLQRDPPRSGRPPGRPGRERVAIDEVAWLVRPRLPVPFPAEQELGRFEDEQVPGRAGASARPLLEAADLPVGRDASASRSTRSRGSYDLVCPCRFRPSRSSAASKTIRSQGARGLQRDPPRSGRPPGRPGRERVAIDEVAWLVRPRLLVPFPAEQELGRFEDEQVPERAGASARPLLEAADLPVGRDASASRSTRSRGSYDLVCSCRFRPSRSSAASKTSRSQSAGGFSETPPRSGRPPGRPGRERVAIDEVAWLVRPRLLVPFPAEQELGRFEDEQVPERGGASARPSSKRPTSRSAGTRARRDRRGRVARTTSSARAVSGRAGARPLRRRAGPRAHGGFSETPPRSGRPPGRPEPENRRRCEREGLAADAVAPGTEPSLARRSPVATGARRNKGAASGFLRMSSRDLPLGRPASSIRQLPSMRSGASAERVAAGFSGPARPAGAPFGSLSRKGRNP